MTRQDPNALWHEEPAERRADALCRRALQIRSILAWRYTGVVDAYCVYGDAAGLGQRRIDVTEIRRNRIAEGWDSLVAELCQEPARMVPEAVAVDFFVRQKAELQGWYYDAKFESEDMPMKTRHVVKDTGIAGAGFLFVVEDSDGVSVERAHPHSVLFDDGGCVETEPVEVIRERRVSRHQLMRKYKGLRAKLKDAPSDPHAAGRDVLIVYEGWFAYERHVVAVKGVDEALVDERWPDPIPWAPLRLMEPSSGFWPESLVMRAAPMQGERNVLDEFAQQEMAHNRTRWIWKQNAIVDSHLDDTPGGYVKTSVEPNTACHVVQVPAVHPEVWGRIEKLDQMIFDALQASDMFASGEKPAGLNSGKAQLVYRDSRSRRHRPWVDAINRWHKRVAEELMRAERRMDARGEGHRVVVRVSGKLKEVPFEDLDTGENAIQLSVESVSWASQSTAFKYEMLTEMRERGDITTGQYFARLGLADFAEEARLASAPTDLVDEQLDHILRYGEMRPPYRYQDLQYALRRTLEKVSRAETDGVPADRIRMLRVYYGMVKAHLRALAAGAPDIDEPAQPPTPPPAPPMGPLPGGPPPVPPVGPVPPPGPGGGVPMNGGGLPPIPAAA